MQKARARLERNAYADTHLGRFQKFRDEMAVRTKKYPTQAAASAEFQSRKRAKQSGAQVASVPVTAPQNAMLHSSTSSLKKSHFLTKSDRTSHTPLKVASGRVEWPGGSAGGAYHNSVVIFSRKKRPFFYFWSTQLLGASLVGPPRYMCILCQQSSICARPISATLRPTALCPLLSAARCSPRIRSPRIRSLL